MYIRFLATVGLLFMSGINLMAQEKYSLRPHWEAGQKYHYQTELSMSMKLSALGNEVQETKVIQESEFASRKEGDKKLVDQQINRLKGNLNLYGQALDFDSEELAKSPPLVQQLFGSMLERKVTLVYDEDDNFVKVQGEALDKATPLGQGSGLSPKVLADQIRASFELGVPDREVAVGDSWQINQKIHLPPIGEFSIRGKATFEGIENGEHAMRDAKIRIVGNFELPNAEGDRPVLLNLDPSTAKFESDVLFNLNDRTLTRSVTKTSLALDFNGNQAQLDQEIRNVLTKKTALK